MNTTTDKNKELILAKEICTILQNASFKAYFAGGFVRDTLLGKESHDIDIATNAIPDESVHLLWAAGYSTKFVGESFGVLLAKKDDFEFEIATFRRDVNCDGRHPEYVEFASAEEDANRRDFTVNAIFFDPIANEYHDFVGGIEDVKSKTLKFVGEPYNRIREDYLRILRFLRFWSNGFAPEHDSYIACAIAGADIMLKVSPDRVMKEFKEKILPSGNAENFFRILTLETPRLCDAILPELYALNGVPQNPVWHPEGDALEHTCRVVGQLEKMTNDPLVILAGAFHDLGKATRTHFDETRMKLSSNGHEEDSEVFVRDIMRRQMWSNEDTEKVAWLVRNHMVLHFESVSKAKLRKLMASPYFDDLLLLTRADDLGANGDTSILDSYMERIKTIEVKETRVLPVPFVNGNTLISLGLKPSPLFKTLLDEVMDAQLNGDISSTEEGITLVKKILDERTYD